MELKLALAATILLGITAPVTATERRTSNVLGTVPSAERTGSEKPSGDAQRLRVLFDQDAKREQQLDPLEAIYRGERVQGQGFAQLFTDALDRRTLASAQTGLAALERINRAKLSPSEQISYDVFAYQKRNQRAFMQPDVRALVAVRPLTHFGGLQVEFPSLMAKGGALPYATVADYRSALELDRAFASVLDQAVLRFREGMASGVVDSRLTITNMIGQIDALLAQKIENSPFTSPVHEFPEAVSAAVRPQLIAAFNATTNDDLYPAYRRLRAFLHDEYLPRARVEVGLSAMRGGAGLYRRLIIQHTTLNLDPAEVHKLGLSEVARIQREMDGVRQELGFTGTLRQFFDSMRSDPRYHPKTREELDQGFAAIASAVDAQVPKYFARVPKTRLLIQPYPAFREKYEAGGSYNQGSADGTRPGVFFYNTYDLPSRFLTGMTTLYLHEGIPGHHFQISLAQEDTSLPEFQRFGGNTAFVEGWALYAETLGYPMGLYKDPLQHWGTLDDEMLRAMRLVVDTGLHAGGWSREQAIDYMLANSGMGRTDATAEVERYIAWPGQALAYKLGALTIQRLRAKAETALGAKFDIRAFHEQVLGSGALPLPILEAKIDRWIAGVRAHNS
ncbi:MAG: DUF885 domain-containing protein [Novosphingobium sp.]